MITVSEIKRMQVSARLDYMKTKNPDSEIVALLISSLVGDIEKHQKNFRKDISDTDTMQIIRSFIKNINETEKVAGQTPKTILEKQTLLAMLPPQKTKDELSIIVDDVCKQLSATSVKEFGKVMAEIRKNHEGTYEGEVLASLIKQKLSTGATT